MKTKYLIAVLIVLIGMGLAGEILFFPNLFSYKSFASQSPEWTQQTGEGISAPACGSLSSPSTSCQSGQGTATLNWSYDSVGTHLAGLVVLSCNFVSISGLGLPTVSGLPCGGSYTYGGLNSNTNYSYAVTWTGTVCFGWSEFGCDNPGPATIDSKSSSFTTPNCAPPALNVNVSVSPNPVNINQAATWTASPSGGTGSYSYSWSGTDGLSGASQSVSKSYSSSGTKTGTVTVTSGSQVITVSASLTVNVPPPGDFTLNPPSAACNSVSLSWAASANANAYRILKGSPRVDISPYQPYTALNFIDYSVSQNTDYLYQIEAYNGAGVNRSPARNMTTPYCPPTLSFSASPASIFEGQSTTLTWSTTFTTSCSASGAWSGSKAVNGSAVVVPLPPPSVTYTLTCIGPGGSTGPQSVVIGITPLALPNWKEIIPR